MDSRYLTSLPQALLDADPQALEDSADLQACLDAFRANESRNESLYRLYEGATTLRSVPDFVPPKYKNLRVPCPWPEIAVQSVVERSQFDGFVFGDNDCAAAQTLRRICEDSDIANGYQMAITDAQITGVSFACVVADAGGASLRWHTAQSAAGIWSHAAQRLKCGFAIVDRERRKGSATGDESRDTVPSKVDFYTEGGVWEFTHVGGRWLAEFVPDAMGAPRIVALVFRPDGTHPLGRSRFTRPMRAIAQEYMANALNLHVASEYTALGQKWVTGLSDEQLAAMSGEKWRFTADAVVGFTDNPQTGTAPTMGTFSQQSMEPILSVKRSLATDFAAAASIPISEILTQDSNPTSAEALAAAKDKLISLVESVNRRSKRTLRQLALMLLAVDGGKSLADLTDEERGVMVHMREPSTPTAAAMADAALKWSQTIEGFGGTSVCQERMGFDEDERSRIKTELNRVQVTQALLNSAQAAAPDHGGAR